MAGSGRNKPSGAPGRGRSSSHTPGRPTARTNTARSLVSPSTPTQPARRWALGFHLTRRAVVLFVIVGVLALMYATSLRVYFDQQLQIAQVRAANEAKQANIDRLKDEIKRWDDAEYVKAQARSRLGWVIPGEVGYRVIGPDGKLIGNGVELTKTSDSPESLQTWWQKLWGSIRLADSPTEKATKPTPSATPTP